LGKVGPTGEEAEGEPVRRFVRAGARRLAPAAGHTPLRRGEDGRGPGL